MQRLKSMPDSNVLDDDFSSLPPEVSFDASFTLKSLKKLGLALAIGLVGFVGFLLSNRKFDGENLLPISAVIFVLLCIWGFVLAVRAFRQREPFWMKYLALIGNGLVVLYVALVFFFFLFRVISFG